MLCSKPLIWLRVLFRKVRFLEMSHEGTLQPGHGLLIGAELAKKLHVTVGETVLLISPMRDETSSWPGTETPDV